MAKKKQKPLRLPRAWVPARTAAAILGISHWSLTRYRLQGILREGYHYRRVGSPRARRATYWYHTARCAALLGIELNP